MCLAGQLVRSLFVAGVSPGAQHLGVTGLGQCDERWGFQPLVVGEGPLEVRFGFLEATEEGGEDEGPAEFTEAFLNDPANIAAGEEIWAGPCRGCHGKSAYPGKAPKLRPARYTPEFVYDRVTNGFRKMPAFKDVYTKEERMSVAAYVLSEEFDP